MNRRSVPLRDGQRRRPSRRLPCSKTDDQDKDRAPIKSELNKAALAILKLRVGLREKVGEQVGTTIRWISVWNEPFFSLQPFRDKTIAQQAGVAKPNDGQAGLKAITRDLADPNDGACRQVRFCEIVAPEMTFDIKKPTSNPRAYDYASWLKNEYERYSGSRRSSAKVDFSRLKYYGAHPYSEIEDAWDNTSPDWKTSALARYMSRLPRNARVWLAETGVFGKRIGQDGAPEIYDAAARKNQAKFLFERLGRIKLGTNGARIYRANYYTVCAGAVKTTDTPVPFDTSLHDGSYAGGGTDCTAGLTPRAEVINCFKIALERVYSNKPDRC